MGNDTEIALKLFIVLSRASKVVSEEANKIIESYELNPTEFAVLELLHHKGRQPIQKIGQKILLRSGSMTYVVDKLEKKGLLERVFCQEDKRVTYMSITPAGKELIERIFPSHEEKIQDLMSVLSKEEQETAIELLKKLGLSIKNLS
ncbi:MarR family transcriptional regulator [Sporosarcina thermotolerans]|uniref:MarR family transcriptional regulator n=1 Tax=Sporosarcina thermotolerans TaxID=633404 RepID=A0AAW9A8C8_9BACL|nr:MarR family transcriptional regulator [Sporosarcina thermotolerans]MDW0115911.1 MarR family transcriptional regulator [Sporosarcina thermotolerans]WHT46869.1 MarR family transcriptional regulator [Sporosarcina thermotolerans]